jgi:hypothetical protein
LTFAAISILRVGVVGDMLEAMARVATSQPKEAMARIASRKNSTISLEPKSAFNFRVGF